MSDSSTEQISAALDAAWPEDFDALVAAPDHHTLLYENDWVRVLDTCIRPGDQTPVHIHRWPAALYILSWSQFVRYDDKGAVLLDSRTVPVLQTPPPALWSEPVGPHLLRNVGSTDLRIITVEVKVPSSFAGIAPHAYGGPQQEDVEYVRAEREAWGE